MSQYIAAVKNNPLPLLILFMQRDGHYEYGFCYLVETHIAGSSYWTVRTYGRNLVI